MVQSLKSTPTHLLFGLLALAIVQGCASTSRAADKQAADADQRGVPSSSAGLRADGERTDAERNLILSEGYSQLYEATGALQYLDKALLVKVESEEIGKLADDASTYFASLRDRLDQLGEDYSGLNLDKTGLPIIERKKRSAASTDRLKSVTPLTGLSGGEFERTLLLTLSGAFNQLQYLAIVMQEEEKSGARKRLLKDMEKNFRKLYDQDVELLERVYFNA